MLRDLFKPGTDEYNLSWALEGAIDLARSRGGSHGMSWIEPGSPPLEGGRFSLQNAATALEQWISELGEERTCKLCSRKWLDTVAHEVCLGCFLLPPDL